MIERFKEAIIPLTALGVVILLLVAGSPLLAVIAIPLIGYFIYKLIKK